jgi:hypothetical protein
MNQIAHEIITALRKLPFINNYDEVENEYMLHCTNCTAVFNVDKTDPDRCTCRAFHYSECTCGNLDAETIWKFTLIDITDRYGDDLYEGISNDEIKKINDEIANVLVEM